MKYIIGFVVGVVVTSLYFMWQIKSDQANQATPTEVKKEDTTYNSSEFQAFYDQFHTDSLFQINHITFPLEGLPPQADSLTFVKGYRWQKEDWRMQKPIDTSNGEFSKTYANLGSDMIIEHITHETGQFGIQRRFTKIGGEWNLIYYAALNRVAPQN